MPSESPTLIAAEELLQLMLSHATDGDAPVGDYKRCRGVLLNDAAAKEHLPRFVRTCHDPNAFWHFIKAKYSGTGSYAARRQYLYEEFGRLLEQLERSDMSPHDGAVSVQVGKLNATSVTVAWSKAVSRRVTDPEGAITAARSLLESVCKTILEDLNVEYDDRNDDLPKLYKRVSKAMKLAPSDHTEDQFKAILGGCTTVVNGLGSIRNRASDAHGHGRKSYRPASRHAALAVNLAGSMALFLMETHEARQTS
ncbi:MAG TPA: abortive infection family protein [Polyangiales bacterium]